MLISTDARKLEQIRLDAYVFFGPVLLKEALRRLCHSQGLEAIERFERAMTELVEGMQDDMADFEAMKEFAIEQLFAATAEIRRSPGPERRCEDIKGRRTQGRSEEAQTLEEQLQSGLEDTFPASDPPAVVSTSIPGRTKPLVGTDEVLRRKRKAKAATKDR